MKINFLCLLSVIYLFCCGAVAFAQSPSISEADKQHIADNIKELEQAFNNGNEWGVVSLISNSNPSLNEEIKAELATERKWGTMQLQFDYLPIDQNMEIISPNEVKVNAKVNVSGQDPQFNGSDTYFVFKRETGQWRLIESDFYKKLGDENREEAFQQTADETQRGFMVAIPIVFLFVIFWIWMLMDCIKRDFDQRYLWLILLLCFHLIAAPFYYFMVKRRDLKRKPLEFKQ